MHSAACYRACCYAVGGTAVAAVAVAAGGREGQVDPADRQDALRNYRALNAVLADHLAVPAHGSQDLLRHKPVGADYHKEVRSPGPHRNHQPLRHTSLLFLLHTHQINFVRWGKNYHWRFQ